MMAGTASFFRLRPGLGAVLASSSPRRSGLLSALGFEFSIFRPQGAEPAPGGDAAPDFAARAAAAKAGECQRLHEARKGDILIIAADTVVCIDSIILGKPADPVAALGMLQRLIGRWHDVYTACHILWRLGPDWQSRSFCCQTRVLFGNWPLQILDAYAHCGEPLDKAGAYAVQGRGAFLVDRLDGSWTNVVGLPLEQLASMLCGEKLLQPAQAQEHFNSDPVQS